MSNKATFLVEIDPKGLVTGSKIGEDALEKLQKSGKDTDKTFDETSKGIGISAVAIGTVVGQMAMKAIGSLTEVAKSAVKLGVAFDASLKELSAITGIAGDSLALLADDAVLASARTGIAVNDQVEAYKLLASQLAEKIDFTSASGLMELMKTQKEVLTLAKASGVDLATAAQTTATVMNQFNMTAEESTRIVNGLAAGSKFGAAEVQDIADAVRNSGSAAASTNQSFETLNAAVQVLAANGINGVIAGTGLKNMFLRLDVQARELEKYGITGVNLRAEGLTETLKKLAPVVENTTALQEVFGLESISTAQILIRNAAAVESMAVKVTGTNVAYEQAAIRMNTLETVSARLTNAFEGRMLQVMNKLTPGLIDFGTVLADLIAPQSQEIAIMEDQMVTFNALIGTVQDATASQEARRTAIETLQAEYPDYIGNIDLEKASTETLNTVVTDYNKIMLARIALKAHEIQIQEQADTIAKLQIERYRRELDIRKQLAKLEQDGIIKITAGIPLQEQYAQAQLQIDAKLRQVADSMGGLNNAMDLNTGKWKEPVKSIADAGLKLKELAEGGIGGAGSLNKLNEEISDAQKEMSDLSGLTGELTENLNKAMNSASVGGKKINAAGKEGAAGGEAAATATENYKTQLEKLRAELDNILAKSGELTAKDLEQISAKKKQIAEIENELKLRAKLGEIPAPAATPQQKMATGEVDTGAIGKSIQQFLALSSAADKSVESVFALDVVYQNLANTLSATSFEDQVKAMEELGMSVNEMANFYVALDQKTAESTASQVRAAIEFKEQVGGQIESGLENMTAAAATAFGEMMVTGEGLDGLKIAVLQSFSGMLEALGQTAIGVAIGVAGIKKALQTLNPAAAFAAGVALLALAGATKAYVASLAEDQKESEKLKTNTSGTGRKPPGFAKGVTNFSGGLARVGEEGEELVVLPPHSNVITEKTTREFIERMEAPAPFAGTIQTPANTLTNQAVMNQTIRAAESTAQTINRSEIAQALTSALERLELRAETIERGEDLLRRVRLSIKTENLLGGKGVL